MTLKWEEIDQYTDRLRVPGGWIVRSSLSYKSVHQVFIADEAHAWILE